MGNKRFTATDKWKKPFIKKLSPVIKLLWFYILDDCDTCGLWQVDFDVAQLRIGEKIDVTAARKALSAQIVEIDDGEKWFIPAFIEFQYGTTLSRKSYMFKAIDRVFTKYDLYKHTPILITDEGILKKERIRISKRTKEEVFFDANFICQYCSTPKMADQLVVNNLKT